MRDWEPGPKSGLSRLLLLGAIVLISALLLRAYWFQETRVTADSVRFDYIRVISPMYLYEGRQGILLLDYRNGNVWFIGKGDTEKVSFLDPVFVVHLPLEKLSQAAP